MIAVFTGLLVSEGTIGQASGFGTTCQLPWGLPQLVAKREGFGVPNSLPTRHNNPGSLVYAGQRGAVRGDRGFARFATAREGWEALERDLRKKLAEGRSLKRAWAYLEDPPRGLYFGR